MTHQPIIQPIPSNVKKGWVWKINGKETQVDSITGHNPYVGYLFYGYNGRFDQPAFLQNPGRLVVYICNHPTHGLLMGGAEEPRILANGKMFTPAGGFDPAGNNAKLAKINDMSAGKEKDLAHKEYGAQMAAREVLEEMGLDVTNITEVGRFVSNRALFIVDLQTEIWNAETVYVCIVDPQLLDHNLTISFPKDKMDDVMPAPEWSGIKKLQFQPYLDCLKTADGVAIGAYSKAFLWWHTQ